MKNTETLQIATPTEREIVLTLAFDAPRRLVLDALTKALRLDVLFHELKAGENNVDAPSKG